MREDSSPTTDSKIYSPPIASNSENETKKRKLGQHGVEPISSTNDISGARFMNVVLTNKQINEFQERLKKESEELIDYCDKVKLWVSLAMPKIEDGDNFGVQIQEEVLSELHRSQESGYNLRDDSRTSPLQRAKICSKLLKYPFIEDYTIALREHDAKHIYMIHQHLIDIKNIYAVLMDTIHKNIQKIQSPKGNNRIGMY